MNNDTISRQAAIEIIDMLFKKLSKDYVDMMGIGYNHAVGDTIAILKGLPSAERRGRWEDVEPAPHNLFYATCSVCGERQTIEVANYCPMCGSSMDEVSE